MYFKTINWPFRKFSKHSIVSTPLSLQLPVIISGAVYTMNVMNIMKTMNKLMPEWMIQELNVK